jgi:hypothetical protein
MRDIAHFIADLLLSLPMFQLVVCKTAIGTDLLNEYNCLCLQVHPIVEHLNFLLYGWKKEVNRPLIKTP